MFDVVVAGVADGGTVDQDLVFVAVAFVLFAGTQARSIAQVGALVLLGDQAADAHLVVGRADHIEVHVPADVLYFDADFGGRQFFVVKLRNDAFGLAFELESLRLRKQRQRSQPQQQCRTT